MPVRFTDRLINSYKPKPGRYEKIEDGGLGIRISPANAAGNAARAWFYSYRFHGVKRRLTLGHYPETSLKDARASRDRLASVLDKGEDPAAIKGGSATFGDLLARYTDSRKFLALAAGTRDSYARGFKKLGRSLLQIPAGKLTRRDLKTHLEKVAEKTPPSAVIHKAAFSAALTWAIKNDLLEYNVARDIELDITLVARDRVLSEEEIRVLWQAFDALPITEQIKDALRLELITALRIGSIVSIKPEHIDLDAKLLRTPKENVKRGVADLWTPLSPMAMQIIERALSSYASKDWLFESPRKRGSPITVRAVVRLFKNLRDCGVLDLDERTTSHDLRRTLATHLSRQEVEREYIKQILNHQKKDVTDIYIRDDFISQKRKYLNLWSEKLAEILRGDSGPLE